MLSTDRSLFSTLGSLAKDVISRKKSHLSADFAGTGNDNGNFWNVRVIVSAPEETLRNQSLVIVDA